MKKTVYIVIISIVTIFCVIAGTIIRFGDFNIGWGFPWGMESNSAKISKSVSLEDFGNVDINLNVMDIEVVEGSEASAYYECSKERYVPEIDVENGTLVIRQKNNKKFNFSDFKNIRCKMLLTVPTGVNYKEFKISNNTGDVKINGVECDQFTLNADTGDIKLNDCKSDKTDIDNDTGDVKLIDCSLGDCKIDNDTGDIKLTDCDFATSEGNMSILNNTGDVEVEGCPDVGLYETDFSTDIGDISVNGRDESKHYTEDAVLESNTDNIRKFTIKTDIGDVTVDQK